MFKGCFLSQNKKLSTGKKKPTKQTQKYPEQKLIYFYVVLHFCHLLILGAADFFVSRSLVRHFPEGLPHMAPNSCGVIDAVLAK